MKEILFLTVLLLLLLLPVVVVISSSSSKSSVVVELVIVVVEVVIILPETVFLLLLWDLLNKTIFNYVSLFHFSHKGTVPLKGGLKKLKLDLSLIPEGNFRIVIAAAEKLKPGIYHFLLGERKYDHLNSEESI